MRLPLSEVRLTSRDWKLRSSKTGAIEHHRYFGPHPPRGFSQPCVCKQGAFSYTQGKRHGHLLHHMCCTCFTQSTVCDLLVFSVVHRQKARQGSMHFVIRPDCMFCRASSRHLHMYALCICRLMSAEAAGPSQPSRAVSERSQHAKGTPPRHPSSTNSYLAGPTFVSAAASAPSAPGQPQLEGQSPEGPSAFIHALSQAPASSPYRPTTESSSDCVQLILGVSEASSSVHAMLSPTSSLQANHEQTSGVNQDDLYAAPAAVHSEQQLDDSLSTSSQLAGVELESDANQSEVEDSDHTGELQRLLAEERKKTAALIGKFPSMCPLRHSCQPAALECFVLECGLLYHRTLCLSLNPGHASYSTQAMQATQPRPRNLGHASCHSAWAQHTSSLHPKMVPGSHLPDAHQCSCCVPSTYAYLCVPKSVVPSTCASP